MLWIILKDGGPEVSDAGQRFVVPSGDWWGLWLQKETWSESQHRNKSKVFVSVLVGVMACGISVPWPRIKLRPFPVKAPSSNHGGGGGCLIAQLCLILCNPTDYSTPGFSVLHCLPELAQTHIHWVGDAIQLSLPSPLALNLSQHQGLF